MAVTRFRLWVVGAGILLVLMTPRSARADTTEASALTPGAPFFVLAGGSALGAPAVEGLPATDARVLPGDVDERADGTLLIADEGHGRVWAIDVKGRLRLVAGTGHRRSTGDGGPAIDASLSDPTALAVTRTGEVLVAEALGARVRLIRSDGTIITVAGTGTPGSSGDGGSATAAQLKGPSDVLAMADGGFLVADRWANRVRRVDAEGAISTIAGTGGSTSGGDGGLAVAAAIDAPGALAMMPDGSLLITQQSPHSVRRVDADGVITTVAGGGRRDAKGGVPAVKARLFGSVDGLAALSDGGFLVLADTVFRVTPDGILRRVLPRRSYDFAGRAPYRGGRRLFVAADGSVLEAEGGFLHADGSEEGRLVRLIASGAPARLAVALTGLVSTVHSLRTSFALTSRASATLTVLRGHRPVAQTRSGSGPGNARLTMHRAFAPGDYTIRVEAQTPDGRVTSDSVTASLGDRLVLRQVRRLLRSEFADNSDSDYPADYHRVGRCRSFGPRRIDCEIRRETVTQADQCVAVLSVSLPASGIPTFAQYRCRRSRRTAQFRAHPHYRGPSAPLFQANLSFP